MHTDPELLALLALDEESGTEHERAHVETCAVCRAELEELRQVVTLARSAADEPLSDPSPRVWDAIRDEIGSSRDRSGPDVHVRLRGVGDTWSAASGEAALATDEHGRLILQVTLDADLPDSGLRQAWLVHRDDPRRRQTLGVLDGRHGLWTVAHAIDLTQFGILDISQQGIGSTEHSGESIVRGELVPAA